MVQLLYSWDSLIVWSKSATAADSQTPALTVNQKARSYM